MIYNDMVARWKEPLGVEGNAGKKEDGSDRKAEGEKVTLNEDDKEEEDKKAKRKEQTTEEGTEEMKEDPDAMDVDKQ